jgi:hypothetical protein
MAGLAYTNDYKSTFSHKNAEKPPSFHRHHHTKSRLVKPKQAPTSHRVYKSITKNTPERPATISEHSKLRHHRLFKPQPTCRNGNFSWTTKTTAFSQKSFPAGRSASKFGTKRSKHVRREPSAASHGDFRRSLYEVTINSMGKVQSRGENA